MDNTNFKEYYSFLLYIEALIGESISKYGDMPPMYFYLYELTLYKIMEMLGGDSFLLDFFRNSSREGIKSLILSYYAMDNKASRENGGEDINSPINNTDIENKIKQLNEEIKQTKENMMGAEKFKVPSTFEEFMGGSKDTSAAANTEVSKDKSDKLIDDYLKKKKSKKTKTSRKKKK